MKPYSTACDQNREAILSIIQPIFNTVKTVLEVGSGTGQHAIYFAEHMPHLIWQCSDRLRYHAGINSWLEETTASNIRPPLTLDVAKEWPTLTTEAVFSANTTHIMHHHEVKKFFAGVGRCLTPNGHFLLYGPFNYNRQYTSDSNQQFDHWLHNSDPHSAIRDFEELNQWATQAGLCLQNDYAMPANNRILHWQKTPA
jgi:cyclopropane fatty-acyl-phospholipid synthase-like methyltransferase